MVFFHPFRLQLEPNFGVYLIYTCLTCFDHWMHVLHTFPHECLLMHCTCTLDVHTLSLDMFCFHSRQLSLFRPFSTYNMFLCPYNALGLYHVSSSFACHIYLILCNIVSLRCFIFCFSFIFSFILHPSCIIFYPCSYLIFFPSFHLIVLSIRDKKGKSISMSIQVCIVISI